MHNVPFFMEGPKLIRIFKMSIWIQLHPKIRDTATVEQIKLPAVKCESFYSSVTLHYFTHI